MLRQAFVGWCLVGSCGAAVVRESAREIPLVKETDVLVVGGSSGAVSAALAARAAGASVYLIAPRPYVGEDLAGTLRLGLAEGETPQTELEKALWLDTSATAPFSYRIDAPTMAPHQDRARKLLCDGRFEDVVKDSVQVDVPKVKVDATLEAAPRFVETVELVVYRRARDYGVQSARLVTSLDGRKWSPPIALKRTGGDAQGTERWTADVNRELRHVGLAAFRQEGCRRMLLGEIVFRTRAGDARRRVPTPIQVKQTFDRALLTNGVDYLTGSLVTDVLRDAAGQVAGVVMANRSGRQAVKAKTVVDATARATVARLAGVPFSPYPVGPHTFTRIVISGEKPHADGMEVRRLEGAYRTFVQKVDRESRQEPVVDGAAWECTLRIPMADGSFASYAAAEQIARDRTFTKKQLDGADTLFEVPPDRALGTVPHVYVLGGCAPLSAKELRPLAFMAKGREIGARAAADARARPAPGRVSRPAPSGAGRAGSAVPGEVRELLQGLHAYDRDLPTVPADACDLPVFGTYDVVVVGGGTAGAPAGIGAGRRGAKTLLVEYLYGLGGVGTLGMIGKYWYGSIRGFTSEHDRAVAALGANVRAVGKREVWRRDNRAAGVELWFGAMACGALTENGRVVGVVVATPQGRGVVRARNVVDATGNSDIAAAAGAACTFLDASELALQGAGLSENRLGATYINSDWGYVNDGDAADQWLFALRGRLGAGRVWDVTQVTNSRERRRILGAATVSVLDVVNRRTFPDTIVQGRSDFDSHGPSIDDICYVSETVSNKIFTANLPYRSILPEKVDGLAVVGLGISVHRDALPLLRMQPDVQNAGYAAGVAAAMASASGKELRAIDVKELQRHLVAIDVIPEEVLSWKDNGIVDNERWLTAVRDLGDGYKDVSLVLTDPARAVPALRAAYAKATTPGAKLVYAHVLGILGDPTGAATLVGQIRGTDPEIVLNPKGLPAFGRRMGERESFMVALGRSGSPLACEPLVEELKKVDARTPRHRVRALALALAALGDGRAAPALEEVLAKPGLGGWARPGETAIVPAGGFCSSPESARCLREINLARALLACGDPHGVARRVLESYARDGRGVFALHARKVLEKSAK
ncbi:MAG: FAD-dependent oxidoreductase [Kiritimatiellia bacterium]